MHKLGFYLQRSDDLDGQLFDAVRQVRPPVLLVHTDNLNDQLLHLNRRPSGPNAFVIGRHFKTIQEEERLLSVGDPAQNGRAHGEEIVRRNSEQAKQRGDNGRLLIDAWISLNEIIPGPASDTFAANPAPLLARMKAYDAFQEAFRQRLQEDGIEAVAFNFAAGNYTEPDHYLRHFPKTLRTYVYLGFHEYGWHHLNPNHHDAAHGDAESSAGSYRRIMAGIRNVYGDQHQVIISEAGMTREYKHKHGFERDPRDNHLGDLGWLCFTEQPPLTEDEYFDALRWYNDTLIQDTYVLGCCLYQVGHTQRFESHRHIGRDNNGNPLRLMQRIQALNQPISPQVASQFQTATIRIRGRLQDRDGKPISGAKVRLGGNMDALGACRQAVIALGPDGLAWDRSVQGIDGDRWHCYQKYVVQEVAGVPYATFKDLVVEKNPSLVETNYEFQPGQSYSLPRNRGQKPDLRWDRMVSGFAGSRWLCWQKFVAGRVLGLTWVDFTKQVMDENPPLKADGGYFYAHNTYCLPQNPGHQQLELLDLADKDGVFRFSDLPAGSYQLTVLAQGYEAVTRALEVDVDQEIIVQLQLQAIAAAPTVQSTAKSTVRVVDGRFFQGGQPFPRFVGVNLPTLLHLSDAQVPDLSLGQYLDEARSLGASVVRAFVPHHTLSNQDIATRLLAVLTELDARDMYLIPVLIDLYSNSGAYPQVAGQWLVNYNEGEVSVRLGPEFFISGYESEAYKEYVRTVVQSVPTELSHAIFCWEIGNELKMEHPGSNPPATKWGDPIQFVKFNGKMASIIKTLDPHRHMVTTGMISTQHVHLKGQAELIRQLYTHPDIDFLTVHVYYGENAGPANDATPNNEPDFDAVFARSLGKPIVVEEAGIHKRNDDFRGRLATDLKRWFKDSHWQGQERQPAVGYMIWRPPFGNMRSGDLHDDLATLRSLLVTAPSMAPMMVVGDGQLAGAKAAASQPLPGDAGATHLNKIGLDLNRPINGRQRSEVVSNPGLIAETGVGWVRLNFVLQDASSPDDPEWQATYAKIIADFQDAGLRIYGLIGSEAVKTPLERRLLHSVQQKTGDGTRDAAEAWLDEYERNFLQIVKKFGNRITHFESYNEPNNWAIPNEPNPVVHPTWFAHLLDRIFRAVKQEGLQIKLVSGPLLGSFHHQPRGESAPNYLREVYDEGRRLGWHSSNSFPFDGVGYHLYLKPNQQTDFADGVEHPEPMDWDTHGQRVREHYDTFIRAIMKAVRDNEGPNSQKQLVISEMGWDSADNSDTWLEFQARSVGLGLQLLADDPQVELGFWFCARDFPGENKGLFRSNSPLAQAQKPALAAFREFCQQRFGAAQPVTVLTLDGGAAPQAAAMLCSVPEAPAPTIRPGLNAGQALAVMMLRKKWVKGTVLHYYFFDKETDGSDIVQPDGSRSWVTWVGSETDKEFVRRAFQVWKDVGINLEFKEVAQRSEAEIRIGFQRGAGHWSYVGRDIIDLVPSENDRTMNFDWRPGVISHLDTALHEIGHTLGFEHEHQNPVAGIVWNEEAVYRYFAGFPNFWDRQRIEFNIIRKISPDEVQGSSWDPNSIMHYPFSAGLIKEPPPYERGLQPAGNLSERDNNWVRYFYALQKEAPEQLTPFVSAPLNLKTGEQKDFAINPDATRTYTFSTFGEADAVMVLFEEIDGEPRYFTAEDDSATEHKATFDARLFAGRRYVLRIRLYHSTGSGQTAVMYW